MHGFSAADGLHKDLPYRYLPLKPDIPQVAQFSCYQTLDGGEFCSLSLRNSLSRHTSTLLQCVLHMPPCLADQPYILLNVFSSGSHDEKYKQVRCGVCACNQALDSWLAPVTPRQCIPRLATAGSKNQSLTAISKAASGALRMACGVCMVGLVLGAKRDPCTGAILRPLLASSDWSNRSAFTWQLIPGRRSR